MESEGTPTGAERRILDALEAAEPAQAATVLTELTTELQSKGINGVNLTGMWNNFKRLLHRRGYYVGTPAQLATSLSEIEAVGEGFDLFDLARSLARYDAVRMDCRGLAGHRVLPELLRFSPASPHEDHRKET